MNEIAIARAIAHDPLVILADEPTGNLDSATGAEILRIFERLHKLKKTIVMVTHDRDIASRTQRQIARALSCSVLAPESRIASRPKRRESEPSGHRSQLTQTPVATGVNHFCVTFSSSWR